MTDIFERSYRRYGYRRTHACLSDQAVKISEKVVRRLMKQQCLIAATSKRRRYGSYMGEIIPAPYNLLNRDFSAGAPNEKWLTDITEFQIPAGKVYLSPMIDCFDGIVVSWSIGTRSNAELVNTMLYAAIDKVAACGERPVVHSDRGGHYRWPGWLTRIADAKMVRSMSRKGCSPDNTAFVSARYRRRVVACVRRSCKTGQHVRQRPFEMRVIKTDEECIINGRTCAGLPVFIRKNDVDWLPADWLKRKFMRGLKPRSVATYSEHLRPLIAHMDESGISWGEINDEWLEQRFNAHQKTGPRVAPQALHTQLQFLRALEESKAVRGLIGTGPNFRIELGLDGQPLWLQKTLAPMTLPSLPSLAAIDSTTAHLAVKDPGLFARNELMMKWQFNAGLRAAEVCGLRCDQLPGHERSLELLEQRKGINVTLTVTKGRPARTLKVHPLLVIETLNWMDSDRERLIETAAAIAQANGQPFEDCGAAFPSSRGGRLSPRSLSNMIRVAFLHAVTAGRIDPSDRVWSHGLRHRGLHEDLRARRAAGQRSAELHAMHHAGHRSLKARQVYVHLDEDADFFPVIDQRERT